VAAAGWASAKKTAKAAAKKAVEVVGMIGKGFGWWTELV
jgi:uncharacterized membrane protein